MLRLAYLFSIASIICCVSSVSAQSSTPATIRLPEARVGVPFSYVPALRGMVEPVRYEWSGDLPDWMDTSNNMLQGIPTQEAAEPLQIRLDARDSLDNVVVANHTMVIKPELVLLQIVTDLIPSVVLREQLHFPISAQGGQGRLRWQANNIELPEGLEVNIDNTHGICVLLGAAEALGEIRFEVSVSDSERTIGPVRFESRVVGPPPPPLRIDMLETIVAHYKTPFETYLRADGGYPPYTWAVEWENDNAPDWLEFDENSGTFSGIPTHIESSRFSVLVSDAKGHSDEKTITLRVSHPALDDSLLLASTSLPSAIKDQPYEAFLAVKNPRGYIVWEIQWEQRPHWLAIEEEDHFLRFSGIPDDLGEWTASLSVRDLDYIPSGTVQDPHVFDEYQLNELSFRVLEENPMNVAPPPELATAPLPILYAGEPFTMQLATQGGWGPLEFTAAIPPPYDEWLDISPTGLFSANSPAASSFAVTIEIVDERGERSSPTDLDIVVREPRTLPLEVPAFTDPKATAGELFHFIFPVRGGVGALSFDLTGAVPSGMQLDADSGTIHGTLNRTGEYPLSIQVSDSDAPNSKVSKDFNLRVIDMKFDDIPPVTLQSLADAIAQYVRAPDNLAVVLILMAGVCLFLLLYAITFIAYIKYRRYFKILESSPLSKHIQQIMKRK